MRINQLDIDNVRNLANVSIQPADSINFLSGPNGSGKSSVLESIYLLSSGRSYRTHLANELVSWNNELLMVSAGFSGHHAGNHRAGLQKIKNGPMRIRLDQQDLKSTSELARLLPIQIIHPDMHELVRGGPSVRRKFLDWGVFHVEPNFHSRWKRYQFALNQRNNLLKGNFNEHEFVAWTSELQNAGEELDDSRQRYLKLLIPVFEQWVKRFAIGGHFTLEYRRGWDKDSSLACGLEIAQKELFKVPYDHGGPPSGRP